MSRGGVRLVSSSSPLLYAFQVGLAWCATWDVVLGQVTLQGNSRQAVTLKIPIVVAVTLFHTGTIAMGTGLPDIDDPFVTGDQTA
jgi:hypothetical protein